jgi:hypothetical protein
MRLEDIQPLLKTKRPKPGLESLIRAIVPVVGISAVVASGWSLFALGRFFGIPDFAAIGIFALLDVVWIQSACVVIWHHTRKRPHDAIEAHRRMQLMYRISVTANAVHGFATYGATVKGVGAAFVYALFPIAFKMTFSNVFPDKIKRAEKAGLGPVLKALHKAQTLQDFTENSEVTPEVLAAFMDGTSATVPGNKNTEVPQVSGLSPEVPSEQPGTLKLVRGTSAGAIRDLIRQGVTDTETIKNCLASSGVKVPDKSYINRLIREAAKADDDYTGHYA